MHNSIHLSFDNTFQITCKFSKAVDQAELCVLTKWSAKKTFTIKKVKWHSKVGHIFFVIITGKKLNIYSLLCLKVFLVKNY